MRMIIDTADNSLIAADGRRLDLYGNEAFELISDLWLKTSWNQKYSYTFTWLGRRSFNIRKTSSGCKRPSSRCVRMSSSKPAWPMGVH